MDASRDAKGLGMVPVPVPAYVSRSFIPQQYLPETLRGSIFYQPSDQGYEAMIAERLERWRKAQAAGLDIRLKRTRRRNMTSIC